MYEIDLRRVTFQTPKAAADSMRRLGGAAVSSILPHRTLRSLLLLHLYARGEIAKLPDIPDGDLSTLASVGLLSLSEDKVEVILK